MMDNSFNKYKADIFKTVKLTPAEERAYFEVYSKTKSMLIRDKIVKANARLVLHIALDYKNVGVPMEDLLSAGFCGLVSAVEKFDVTRGLRFMTYALYWIKANINTAIELDKNLISIPWNKRVAINKSRKSAVKDANLAKYDSINKGLVSFDSPAYDNSKNTIADIVKDDNAYDVEREINTDIMVKCLLSCLPEEEKQVLRETYGIDCDKPNTLRNIADHMGCSHSRVKQLRDQALRRIKKYTAPQMLDSIRERVA